MKRTGTLLTILVVIGSLMALSSYSRRDRHAGLKADLELVTARLEENRNARSQDAKLPPSLPEAMGTDSIRTEVALVASDVDTPPAALESSPAEILPPEPPLSILPSSELLKLYRSNSALQTRVIILEGKLAAAGIFETPVTAWLEPVPLEERPSPVTIRKLSEYMHPYPVELSRQEGEWITSRIRLDDWLSWGPSIDEALILYLGPHRLADDLPADVLASLVVEWEEEGYFN